jgi:GNAT superfamily N-acetyltransferase
VSAPVDPAVDRRVDWRVETWRRGDETALRAWWEAREAAYRHDHDGLPDDPWEEVRLVAARDRPDEASERLLLRHPDGRVAGGADVGLPLRDNRDVATVDVFVAPAARRAGGGTALLAAVRGVAGSYGRTRLVAETGAPLGTTAPGEGFARARGATPALTEVRRVLDLRSVRDGDLEAAAAQARARAGGYELVRWSGTPDGALLDDLALLRVRMSMDAPMGELDWEPEQWDAERVRVDYAWPAARGREVLSCAVRHLATGRLVGWTDLAVPRSAPEHVYQWDLLVLREHRGHRLGLLLKAENLLHLRRRSPAARCVHTWNAATNRHMIAINERVGFRPLEEWCEWVLPV